MKRIVLIAVLLAGAAGCGGSSEPDTYSLAPSKECARTELHGVMTPEPDFVASTASGGSFRMTYADNAVLLWKLHPTPEVEAQVADCLR